MNKLKAEWLQCMELLLSFVYYIIGVAVSCTVSFRVLDTILSEYSHTHKNTYTHRFMSKEAYRSKDSRETGLFFLLLSSLYRFSSRSGSYPPTYTHTHTHCNTSASLHLRSPTHVQTHTYSHTDMCNHKEDERRVSR